ncbi:transporter substrate-binding domain-containing protein [Marinobacter sp. CAU 1620]|nr:transporter substrate-binding domain-containing protein [Marinobacter arenosus]
MRDEEAEVIVVNSWEQAIGMLRKGRADAVPIPQVLVPTLMKDYEYTYYQQYAGRLGVSFYIAKRHENTGLTEKLRDAIGECSQA